MNNIKPEIQNIISLKKPIYVDRGTPSSNTPEAISRAGIQAINAKKTYYTDIRGTKSLRQIISDSLHNKLGIKYNPEQEIIVTPGAGPGIFILIMALSSLGDSILIPDPCWPGYKSMINALNRKAILYPMLFKTNKNSIDKWNQKLQSLITPKTRLIILNFPHNPTGINLNKQWLLSFADLLEKYPNLIILSDETYHEIIFDNGKYISPVILPELKSRSVLIHTLSKSYAMTGWRIGYVAAPLHLACQIYKTHIAANCHASSISQETAAYALEHGSEIIKKFQQHYQFNRDYLISELNAFKKIKCLSPKGTFYAFPDISEFGVSSNEFVESLAESEKIFVYSGSIYGSMGENHIRINFAVKFNILKELIHRLKRYIG
ncbi:MAG: hypothetical protein B6I26_03930 [Desulfobacteraceae bacterium 4572_130]|nr:MAG: hypothetical protein B6I26_03930 [Desulfobacteraceae bacterium 4572_130]